MSLKHLGEHGDASHHPILLRGFRLLRGLTPGLCLQALARLKDEGVIDAAENEAAGIEQMKFYEVGPDISLTQHAITVRPLAISEATFERLTEEEQACVLEAGAAGGKLGREIESGQDSEKLAAMEEAGLLKTHEFTERDKLLELAGPVKRAYAEELGALDVLEAIEAVE